MRITPDALGNQRHGKAVGKADHGRTMARDRSLWPSAATKDQSILIRSTGNASKYDRDEYPVPRSWSAIWIPGLLSDCIVLLSPRYHVREPTILPAR